MNSARKASRLLGILVGTVMVAGSLTVGTPAAAAVEQVYKPTAVVSLGDNGISGEGAGSYEPGTDGENGNYCHRSTNALVHKTGLAEKSFNLACSGAKSEHIRLFGSVLYNEFPQANRLLDIAKNYDVTTVIMRVGSNDDPQFSPTVGACVATYLNPSMPDCSVNLRAVWSQRLAAMIPKVRMAVVDVQLAMNAAGYMDSDYNLVLTSYASPITEKMTPSAVVGGCPFRINDARWARTEGVPQLNAALRQVAYSTGANFLDLSNATDNREACARPSNPSAEWQTRITVDPYKMIAGTLTPEEKRRSAESFHLNASAHKQLGGCVREFVLASAFEGWCEEGYDGNLHAVIPGP
jgi:GDSL-like Lipase/Acylhydrolase family